MKQILFSIIWISFLTLGLLSLGSVPLYAATPCDEIPTPSASATPIINYDKNKPTEYALLAPLPNIDPNLNCNEISNVTLVTYLNTVFRISIALAGVFAVFMIVLGGFQYLTTDAIGGKEEGKERIWNALQGLIMVLSSYFILSIINPRYVTLDPNVIKPLTNLQQLKSDAAVDFIDSQAMLTKEAVKKITIEQAKAIDLRNKRDEANKQGDHETAEKLNEEALAIDKSIAQLRTEEIFHYNYKLGTDNIKLITSDNVYLASSKTIVDGIDAIKSHISQAYKEGEKDLHAAGEPAGSPERRKLVNESNYYLFSLTDELETTVKTAMLNAPRTPLNGNIEDEAKEYITTLKNNMEINAKLIRDETLSQKYKKETQQRISTLTEALQKNK